MQARIQARRKRELRHAACVQERQAIDHATSVP
jgi:hypothetical protein